MLGGDADGTGDFVPISKNLTTQPGVADGNNYDKAENAASYHGDAKPQERQSREINSIWTTGARGMKEVAQELTVMGEEGRDPGEDESGNREQEAPPTPF